MASHDAAAGWLAVLGAVACWGSFGVPIKSRRVLAAEADALVFQLFKSLACFGSSLAVLLFRQLEWTGWATVGATLWVLTGTLAIYAIQRAGLGVAQTTYSSLSVFTSFLWGVAAFGEAGSSVGLSLLGLAMVAGGLAGLGHAASRPRPALQRVPSAESTNFFLGSAGSGEGAATAGGAAGLGRHGPAHQDEMGGTSPSGLEPIREGDWDEPDPQPAGDPALGKGAGGGSSSDLQVHIGGMLHHRSTSAGDLAGGGPDPPDPPLLDGVSPASSSKDVEGGPRLLGPKGRPGELRIIARQNWGALCVRLHAAWASSTGRGVLAAVAVGLLNGSFLVPFKLARQHSSQAQGIDYVFPFAASSLVVTLLACTCYYGLLRRQAPALHARAVAGPALLTGVLWSAGNLCSIYAVQLLGLSVGFPAVQCQLVVSTLWAVLYYREVPPGARTLWLFLGSSLAVVGGMVLLAVFGS